MKSQISIIIPVFNEAPIIDHTISQLSGLDDSDNLEIIVVDGDPGGKTLQAVSHKGALRIIAPKGRGSQMNAGAAVARGEILLFLHADTTLARDSLGKIDRTCGSNHVVCGAFRLGIQSDRKVFRLIEWVAAMRSRFTGIPYGDQAFFFKKIFFDQIGRYKEIPIMEDVELMKRVKAAGKKIEIIPTPVRTSARRWEKEGVVLCTLRNWALITLYNIGVPPAKLAKFYC